LSRLNEEVREKRGLSYGAGANLLNLKHADALVIGTSTSADRAGETLGVIKDVVGQMAAEGPTPEELASAKKYVIGSYALNELSSSSAIANTMVGLQLRGLGPEYISDREDKINAVTIEDVKAVAAKLLGAKPTTMLLGPAAPAAPPVTPVP
jgi:zinc protease